MADTERILGDITVLELSHGISGAYCGKLLAGLGARVIKVEPPNGESDRDMPPFAGDVHHRRVRAGDLHPNRRGHVPTERAGAASQQEVVGLFDLHEDVFDQAGGQLFQPHGQARVNVAGQLARVRRHEPGVVGEVAGVLIKCANVDHVGTKRACTHRELVPDNADGERRFGAYLVGTCHLL